MARHGHLSTVCAITALLSRLALAQQLDGNTMPYETLSLSDACFAAVNTTVSSCPGWLARYTDIWSSSADMILGSTQLGELCDTTCRTDLTSLKKSISAACTEPNDVMVPDNNIAYPATFLVDRYLYTSGLSCLKDTSSNTYCDIVVASWANQTNYTDTQTCSYCELGLQQAQLSSPFGYSEVFAEQFADTTASCGAAGYAYATPTTYALNATTAPATPACTGSSYTVQEDQSCVWVSGNNSVSTYSLLVENSLNIACNNFPDPGESVCIPKTCSTYQLSFTDTCDSLVAAWNITFAQLIAWNPMINPPCSNLASFRGWYICSSSPTGTISAGQGDAVTTAAPVPTDAQPQSNTDCATWYYVLAGESCSSVSLKFSIALTDFYFLNPQVDDTCSNLWANTSYCVKAVGNIATYTNYPTSTASTTFTRPSSATVFVPSPVQTPALAPTAAGTVSDCVIYENAFNSDSGFTDLNDANSCQNWAWAYDVSVANLLEWNPSLDQAACTLKTGSSYCIRLWDFPPNITYPYDYCMAPNTTLIPATSVQPSECSCYIQIRAQDKEALNFTCAQFPDILDGLTVTQLTDLNPWVGGDANCDTNLWSSMSADGLTQLCILKGDPTEPDPPPTTTTGAATPTGTSPVAPPAETQPETSTDCTKWHVVADGDGCWAIANTYGITLDLFYELNPGVGTDCSALWLGYAVCVGV